ncbi:hypothetical protein Q2T43_19380 [Aeromonas veronii]|uniref:hypothetical protein n=1 Tax=Aeromonas veronii TaxID=654 RepID=UPI002666F986|nr:hypothetical protein [Aeromonas veronii]MDO2438374.1 hypothetical protein [Aeromonas veronii]
MNRQLAGGATFLPFFFHYSRFINDFISAIFTDDVAFKAIHVGEKGAGGPAGNEVLDKGFAFLLRFRLFAKGFVDQHHDMVGLALTTRADALFSG